MFDFTDDADLAAAAAVSPEVEVPAARERRLATGTVPRLELRGPPEPPDSARATTRMTVEEVLELRAVSLEARQERAATQPLDGEPALELSPALPIPRDALPHLLPVRAPAWRRLDGWRREAWRRLADRRWELRDMAAALAVGIAIGLLAAC